MHEIYSLCRAINPRKLIERPPGNRETTYRQGIPASKLFVVTRGWNALVAYGQQRLSGSIDVLGDVFGCLVELLRQFLCRCPHSEVPIALKVGLSVEPKAGRKQRVTLAIEQRLDLSLEEGETAVLAALWDLVWAGLVTNDTFAPLRTLGRGPGTRRGRRERVLAGGRC